MKKRGITIRMDGQLAPGQTIEARPIFILRPKHGIRMTFTEASSREIGALFDRGGIKHF